MNDPVQLAKERFAQGLNCSQAVFAAFAAQAGLSEKVALQIASPFGAGLARQGNVCGAVTGALMALGIQRGTDSPQGKEETYRLAQQFVARFKATYGTILCKDLIGYDVSNAEGLQAARDSRIFATICPAVVEHAARLLEEFLANNP